MRGGGDLVFKGLAYQFRANPMRKRLFGAVQLNPAYFGFSRVLKCCCCCVDMKIQKRWRCVVILGGGPGRPARFRAFALPNFHRPRRRTLAYKGWLVEAFIRRPLPFYPPRQLCHCHGRRLPSLLISTADVPVIKGVLPAVVAPIAEPLHSYLHATFSLTAHHLCPDQ